MTTTTTPAILTPAILTTPAKADRYANRAPRGGAVSPVNGLYYRGGTWMPMVPAHISTAPAPLIGSTRQIPWANRLRDAAIARTTYRIDTLRLRMGNVPRREASAIGRKVERLEKSMGRLRAERSASRIIERLAGRSGNGGGSVKVVDLSV